MSTKQPVEGLYRSKFEHDSCGFGLIAHMDDKPSHDLVSKAINSLARLTHRGAIAADGKTGDGCGLLMKKPDAFLREAAKKLNITLGKQYAAGLVFINNDSAIQQKSIAEFEKQMTAVDLQVAGWRDLPIDPSVCGEQALEQLPTFKHVYVDSKDEISDELFESKLFLARRRIELALENIDSEFYITSLSGQVLSYKGLVMPENLPKFYLDLQQPELKSSICVFHQRFSTNTWPRWKLAQPFRFLAHNGEINTIQGNRNWSVARAHLFKSPTLPNMAELLPLVSMTGSDSSSLDNMLEVLLAGGMDIFRAMRLLIPPAWQNMNHMDPDLRAFYEYHSMHMESWDGPAGIVLTDGRYAACISDRNGLRPVRYVITKDRHITLASEVGVYD